ncbi:MAG: DUF3040 domain-containing protein [Acidimicrobiales bacterium]
MPLSEEEQRILQEMEQKLREHDRDFIDRVSHGSHRLRTSRATRWSAVGFIAGTVLLLGTFRYSLALGVCGLLLMVVCALAFAQHVGQTGEHRTVHGEEISGAPRTRLPQSGGRSPRNTVIADEWSEMRRRMRSRFGHRG